MATHSHFNCCIRLALPNHADCAAYVFHYQQGAVAPSITEAELDETIAKILVELADAPGNLVLSVETVLSRDELAAQGSVATDQLPTFALMHRRFDLIRLRLARHGLATSRVTAQIL